MGDSNLDLFLFLPDDEILLQRKILCAQDLAEQIKEMKAAEKRWESQASSPNFKLSHKKPEKKKNYNISSLQKSILLADWEHFVACQLLS